MNSTPFPDLFGRVRSGDAAAAEELVRKYEPEILRAIRVRLTDAEMRRVVDSIDICQSVLAGFFVRTAAGQFDFETPEEMLAMLITMARNRVIDLVRRSRAERRDRRRNVPIDNGDGAELQLSKPEPSPASVLVSRELIEQVRSRLAPEELRLMEQRAEGLNWNQIAEGSGEQANAVRMRLTRALDRVAEELGLEESHG